MNELSIVKIIQKTPTKFAVLFVLLGSLMAFLIPVLIEEAKAWTPSRATSTAGNFHNVIYQMFEGKFYGSPVHVGPTITWITTGDGFFGGAERGRVLANIGENGRVVFHFSNPERGANTCLTQVLSGPYQATCNITQGNHATATFRVSPLVQGNENNYCDILNKFGGEQTRAIREKLNC
jgi:hypothetical protein